MTKEKKIFIYTIELWQDEQKVVSVMGKSLGMVLEQASEYAKQFEDDDHPFSVRIKVF